MIFNNVYANEKKNVLFIYCFNSSENNPFRWEITDSLWGLFMKGKKLVALNSMIFKILDLWWNQDKKSVIYFGCAECYNLICLVWISLLLVQLLPL